ncbi:uncharacterized protein [Clytia hemisphaerica]|uniref:Uncharacterized protein n=1 Tax=Clytia hemisphaerica TaxID=252671 RepID=A0A7M5WJG0_9CNID|eukprot:TCONS_00012623-protein
MSKRRKVELEADELTKDVETQTEDDLTSPRKDNKRKPKNVTQLTKSDQNANKNVAASTREDLQTKEKISLNCNSDITTKIKVPVMQYQAKNARMSKKSSKMRKPVTTSEKSTNMERQRTVSENESLDISSALFELGRDLKVPIANNTIVLPEASSESEQQIVIENTKPSSSEVEKTPSQSKETPIKDKVITSDVFETVHDNSETTGISISKIEELNSENLQNTEMKDSETSENDVMQEIQSDNKGDEVNKENQVIENSSQNTIRTIDAINRQAIKILDRLPPTMVTESITKLTSVQTTTDISTVQELEPTPVTSQSVNAKSNLQESNSSNMVSQVESCLKLLSDGKFTGFLHTADCKAHCSHGQSCVSSSIQNVCEQFFNAPMSANIASMFAKRRNKSGETGAIECPELTRVRIAESLLLLGELSKSQFCVGCKKPVDGDCTIHGNTMKTLHKTRSVESLPDTLTIQVSSIPNSGLGVFSLSIFEAGSIFGPMEGEELTVEQNQKQSDSSFIWEVYDNDRQNVAHYLDCFNQEKSNWLRFVNCARFEEEQNLIAEQYDKKIFFKAYKKILPGDELLVWYGNASGSILQSMISVHGEKEITTLSKDERSATSSKEKSIKMVRTTDTGDLLDMLDDEGGLHQCNKCLSVFSSEYYLERHKTYVCPELSEFRCDKCSRLFKNIANFKRHQRRGCDLAKTFHCIICSASFTQKANLKVHLKTHLNIRDFKCQYCDRLFSRNTFLKNHIMSVHDKEKPFVCHECGKTFSRMDSMKRHASLHKERSAQCNYCGMTYHTLNNLNMHVKRSHSNNEEMLEDKCRLCFGTFKDIKNHMFYLHQKKPLEKCNICHKSFRNLVNHMRSHEHKRKDSREVCKICHKSFISLNGHMKKHLNDRKNAAKMLEEFDEEETKEKKSKKTEKANEKVKTKKIKIENKDENGVETTENEVKSTLDQDYVGNAIDNAPIEFVVAVTCQK